MSKSEVVQIRVTPDELHSWQDAAELEDVSLSQYLREAEASRLQLERRLREQEARDREIARRQRIAIAKLAEREDLRLEPGVVKRAFLSPRLSVLENLRSDFRFGLVDMHTARFVVD